MSCVHPEISGGCFNIFRLVKISGVCTEISIMCLETLIVQSYFICFLSYDTTNFQIAESLRHVSGSFEHVLKISRCFKSSGTCPGFFTLKKIKMNIFFHVPQFQIAKHFLRVSKFFLYIHKDNIIFLSYDTKNFRIAQKFSDSNATLLPGFFSLCGADPSRGKNLPLH